LDNLDEQDSSVFAHRPSVKFREGQYLHAISLTTSTPMPEPAAKQHAQH